LDGEGGGNGLPFLVNDHEEVTEMGICKKCGAQMQDDMRFCPVCGADATAATAEAEAVPRQSPQADADANKGMAILAYIIFFIPLLVGAHKTSPYAKFHVNQGTVLFLFALGWGIVYSILITIFTALLFTPTAVLTGSWGAFGILTTILGLLWLIPALLCILGIVNAATGKLKTLPIIGKFTIIK
jgi:hypothetical protein